MTEHMVVGRFTTRVGLSHACTVALCADVARAIAAAGVEVTDVDVNEVADPRRPAQEIVSALRQEHGADVLTLDARAYLVDAITIALAASPMNQHCSMCGVTPFGAFRWGHLSHCGLARRTGT
jgi:sulfite reductase beta subunit-like hemoprotein